MNNESNAKNVVFELRVALTTNDYARMRNFYCKGLGIKPSQLWNNGQGQAMILEMGKATLEIFDEEQAKTVDQIEVGKRSSGRIRFALQVPDLEKAQDRLRAHGEKMVNNPVMTPWGDKNLRIQDPDGMQITLFQKSRDQ